MKNEVTNEVKEISLIHNNKFYDTIKKKVFSFQRALQIISNSQHHLFSMYLSFI